MVFVRLGRVQKLTGFLLTHLPRPRRFLSCVRRLRWGRLTLLRIRIGVLRLSALRGLILRRLLAW